MAHFDPRDDNPEESAASWLAHEGGTARELADEVADMAPVVAAIKVADAQLNHHTSNLDILVCSVDGKDLEQQLALAIQDLGLRKDVDTPLTPGEFHRHIVRVIQGWWEYRLRYILEYLTDSREAWTDAAVEPFVGWERNGAFQDPEF